MQALLIELDKLEDAQASVTTVSSHPEAEGGTFERVTILLEEAEKVLGQVFDVVDEIVQAGDEPVIISGIASSLFRIAFQTAGVAGLWPGVKIHVMEILDWEGRLEKNEVLVVSRTAFENHTGVPVEGRTDLDELLSGINFDD